MIIDLNKNFKNLNGMESSEHMGKILALALSQHELNISALKAMGWARDLNCEKSITLDKADLIALREFISKMASRLVDARDTRIFFPPLVKEQLLFELLDAESKDV